MCENVLGYVLIAVPLGEVNIVFSSAAKTERENAIAPNALMEEAVNVRLSIGKEKFPFEVITGCHY